MTFSNSQWEVTEDGLETTADAESPYFIEASRLVETTRRGAETFYDWPVHLAEKTWVDLGAFCEAYQHALEFHKGRYSPQVDDGMIERSFEEASRIARSR